MEPWPEEQTQQEQEEQEVHQTVHHEDHPCWDYYTEEEEQSEPDYTKAELRQAVAAVSDQVLSNLELEPHLEQDTSSQQLEQQRTTAPI